MRVSKGNQLESAYACQHYHYSRKTPVATHIYNIWNDEGEWCGVIIFGPGATPNIAREYDMWQGQVLELVRVALNGKQGQGRTSEAVAMALKTLHREAPWVDLVVSYADKDEGHIGTLYQATNWIYVGETAADSRGAFVIFGKKTHQKSVHSRGWKQSLLWIRENIDPCAEEFVTKGKRKYIFPMNKKVRRKVKVLSKPYPKGEK